MSDTQESASNMNADMLYRPVSGLALHGCPCVNVPGLRGSNGAPVGVQAIGRPWDDAQTLAAAAFVEQAMASAGKVAP